MTNTNVPSAPSQGFVLGNKLYDKAKWVTMVLIPALSTLYFTLSGVLELPYTTQVIGTLAALATFFGVLLGLSTKSYNTSDNRFGGSIDIVTGVEGKKVFTLALNSDPEDLETLPEVTFI